MDEPGHVPFEARGEDLTWREQEVLALLAERLTNREIAARLILAESTVKEHVGNILGKLYVKNRRQAVERARVLGLLEPGPGAVITPSHNLPASVTSFIGREAELAPIASLLSDPSIRLVTLTGPPGTGKTRLALQAAGEMSGNFDHGVFFVPLAPIRNPDLLANAIAKVLGLGGIRGQAAGETLAAYLRAKETLLLLDNFEHIISAASLVANLLAAASALKVLVTSREKLHLSGEHEFPVTPLELPDSTLREPLSDLSQRESISLFTGRAQAARPDFQLTTENADAVAKICFKLDGLPLAIELATARLKLFDPESLLELVEDSLNALTGGPLDLPARQRTMRGTTDWSYELLEPDERRIFARLGVFLGGFTIEAAERVCSGDLVVDMTDMLTSLLNKSLLQRKEGVEADPRFTMLETLREYAREKLDETGEDEMLLRHHAQYFLSLAEESYVELRSHDQSLWLDRLEGEHNNMRGALDWALAGADPELALRLAGALGQFWWKRNHYVEGLQRTEQALAQSLNAPPEVRGRALNSASWLTFFMGHRLEEGKFWGDEALSIFQALGSKREIARAHCSVGLHAVATGDFDTFEKYFKLALEPFQELEDDEGLALVYTALGEVARLRDSDYERAEAFYQESLSLSRKLDNTYFICTNLFNLGDVAGRLEQYERQQTLVDECLRLAWTNKIRDFCAYGLYGLAMAMSGQNQPEPAARLFGAYRSFLDSLGTRPQPHEATYIERELVSLREELGQMSFDEVMDEGRAMEEEQAVAYALNLGRS
jgi:predicted ATPase/DNA-binding CsgD family transcriptional regulator